MLSHREDRVNGTGPDSPSCDMCRCSNALPSSGSISLTDIVSFAATRERLRTPHEINQRPPRSCTDPFEFETPYSGGGIYSLIRRASVPDEISYSITRVKRSLPFLGPLHPTPLSNSITVSRSVSVAVCCPQNSPAGSLTISRYSASDSAPGSLPPNFHVVFERTAPDRSNLITWLQPREMARSGGGGRFRCERFPGAERWNGSDSRPPTPSLPAPTRRPHPASIRLAP